MATRSDQHDHGDSHPDQPAARTEQRHDHGQDHDHGHGHDGPFGFLTSLFRPHSHDAADSVDDALAGSEEGIRAVKLSLIGLGITAVLQLVVVWFSGSVALLADTIHNFADASTAIPLWIAFSVGRQRADTPTDTVVPRTWPASSLC
jgi:Co/Zn/Cd efflux system component